MRVNGKWAGLAAALFILCCWTGGCQSVSQKQPAAPLAQAPAASPAPTPARTVVPIAGTVVSGPPIVLDPKELLIDADADPLYGDAPLAVHFTVEPFDEDDAKNPQYVWNFGDGSPETREQRPTHTYESPGDYTATVKVTEAGGKSGSDTFDISVYEPGK